MTSQPKVLSIAGSDSGSGAGIQADLKTISSMGCYALTAITSVTAQNTMGVQQIQSLEPSIVTSQITSVVTDIGVDAVKIGMLGNSSIIHAVVKAFTDMGWTPEQHPPIVLDPVCVSTSGHILLDEDSRGTLKDVLLPWASLVTPNIPEAEILSGLKIESEADMVSAAQNIGSAVLLKGGHLNSGSHISDVLYYEGKLTHFEHPVLVTKNTHGTGCTLSSAVASHLALGDSFVSAVRKSIDYVTRAIELATPIGHGFGPVNHFYNLEQRLIAPRTKTAPTPFTDYLKAQAGDLWNQYVNHAFPRAIALDTIKRESYLYFIKQDYHFLQQYSKVQSIIMYKTDDLKDIEKASVVVKAIANECEKHIERCAKYGLSRQDIIDTEESVTNIAYTRYVNDIASRGDILEGRVAIFPCLLGYGEAANAVINQDTSVKSGEYFEWVEEYASEWYQGAIAEGIETLEAEIQRNAPSQSKLDKLARIFIQATKLEIAFWDAALASV